MEMSSVKSPASFAFAIVLPILLIPSSLAKFEVIAPIDEEQGFLDLTGR